MAISGQEFTEEIIKKIQETVEEKPRISRRALSLVVCEWLYWRGENGRPKEMSSRVALLKLQRKGMIRQPEPIVKPSMFSRRKHRGLPPFEIPTVSCNLDELGAIEIVKVESGGRELSEIRNTLMGKYHYLGSGPLCGAQMRYVIRSEWYGWLEGLSFSASAWRVEARVGG